MAKSADETTEPEKPELVPQPHGGALRTGGKPGNKGGGRPPDEFKRRMAELASSDEALEYLAECLRGDHGAKAAVSAHKHVSERGYGKEPQAVGHEVSGPGGGPLEVVRRIVKADAGS